MIRFMFKEAFYFEITLDLRRSCKDSTKSFHKPFTQLLSNVNIVHKHGTALNFSKDLTHKDMLDHKIAYDLIIQRTSSPK